jgi:hypothetical protein
MRATSARGIEKKAEVCVPGKDGQRWIREEEAGRIQ